jgi:hypothetical protein
MFNVLHIFPIINIVLVTENVGGGQPKVNPTIVFIVFTVASTNYGNYMYNGI